MQLGDVLTLHELSILSNPYITKPIQQKLSLIGV
jgi:hypothetical protein